MSTYQAFGVGRYYSPSCSEPYYDYSRVARVITKQINDRYGDLGDRINKIRRQWNDKIRDDLRAEMGFQRLQAKTNEGVKIIVSSELPSIYRQIFEKVRDPFQLNLLLNQSLIEQTSQGLNFLEDNLEKIQEVSLFSGLDLPSIRRNYTACNELLNMIHAVDLAGQITHADEDPFGAYFIKSGTIYIYWVAIGLGAMLLNIPVEALTLVVMAHELAHAYTHRGEEINGDCWDEDGFAASELSLIEGLAQHYTGVISLKNELYYPEMNKTFKVLLQHQSSCYTDFQQWYDPGQPVDGELIRHCMRLSRMKAKTTFDEFTKDLLRTRAEWRPKTRK